MGTHYFRVLKQIKCNDCGKEGYDEKMRFEQKKEKETELGVSYIVKHVVVCSFCDSENVEYIDENN